MSHLTRTGSVENWRNSWSHQRKAVLYLHRAPWFSISRAKQTLHELRTGYQTPGACRAGSGEPAEVETATINVAFSTMKTSQKQDHDLKTPIHPSFHRRIQEVEKDRFSLECSSLSSVTLLIKQHKLFQWLTLWPYRTNSLDPPMDPLQQRSNSAKICLEVHDGYPCIFASILSTMFALTRSRVLVPYSYGANS